MNNHRSPEPHSEDRGPYVQAVEYAGERAERQSNRAYTQARDLLYRTREADLSTFRLALPTRRTWCVVLLGRQPDGELAERLAGYLAGGDPIELPESVVGELARRRREAEQIGPWVERRRGRG